ncbi:MAG: 16S rRNA (cytosine(967)-C(5))-methyltransferase RsmB [Smithellaceae bacterium]|nr:16S rRNA (cytosine(967)-C(5))-methyltransferase RsmB [Smithellaceae bacterium]
MKKTIRRQTVDILNSVSQSEAFAGNLIDAHLDQQNLSGTADGRLLTHLVYGVLRMQGHLDWIISQFYRGDYAGMDENVKNILRTGLYQLKFSERLPAFAVVNEAVKIAKETTPAAAGLTNAVLRSYLRNPDKISFPSFDQNPDLYIATFHSHPLWLVDLWLNIYGKEETLALCRANNELPPLTIRINTLKISVHDLMEKLKAEKFSCIKTRFSPDGINLSDSPTPIQKTIFYKEGLLRFQDEAAQLVSYMVGPQDGENVLDACSGTGGKTLHLANMMNNCGRIMALDCDYEKITQLRKEAARMGVSIIEPVQADLKYRLPAEYLRKFDHVLVDAPCSGTGTLRRNPEIKWRLTASSLDEFAKSQTSILHNASDAVKKGGHLIYCTCSVLSLENEEVIRHFLTDHPDFTVLNPSTVFSEIPMDNRGFLRTYPHRHSMDGFFCALLKRRI